MKRVVRFINLFNIISFLLPLFCLFWGYAYSDTTSQYCVVQGYVRDSTTQQMVPNVKVSVDSKSAYTDSDGYFQIPNVSHSQHVIHVDNDYFSDPFINFDATSQNIVNLTLEVSPGGVIHGTVTDQNQVPLNNLNVILNAENSVVGTGTDQNGEFKITGQDLGFKSYRIQIDGSPTYSSITQTDISFPQGQKDLYLTYALTSANNTSDKGTILGVVTNDSGSPITGARVYYNYKPVPSSVLRNSSKYSTTDDQGQFTINNVILQNLALLATSTGYVSSYKALQSSQDTIANFTLSPSHYIGGKVIDQDGNLIPYARFEVNTYPPNPSSLVNGVPYEARYVFFDINNSYNPGNEYSSDTVGQFRIDNLSADTIKVTVTKEGYTPIKDTTLDLDRDDYILTLGTGGSIAGIVRDAESEKPIQHFKVFINATRDSSPGLSYISSNYMYNGVNFFKEDGSFSISQLPSDQKYRITVKADGYWEEEKDPVEISLGAPQDKDKLEFRLQKLQPTQGTVIDNQTGKVISGVQVYALPKQDYKTTTYSWNNLLPNTSKTTTDVNGHFQFDNLAFAQGALGLQKQGYAKTYQLNVDFTHDIQARLYKSASVTIIFSKNTTIPLDTTIHVIMIQQESSGMVSYGNFFQAPDKDGKCVYKDMPPGNYRTHIYRITGELNHQFTLAEGQDYVLDLSGPPPLGIFGKITYKGAPADQTWLYGYSMDSPKFSNSAVTDKEGNYELAISSPGETGLTLYKSITTAPRQNISTHRRFVVESGNTQMDINLPDSAIHGLAIDTTTGKPLKDILVTAYQKKKEYDNYAVSMLSHSDYTTAVWTPIMTVTTAQNGQFSFEPIDSGDWLVAMDKESGITFHSKPFHLRTNETKNNLVLMIPETGSLELSVSDEDSGNRLIPLEVGCADTNGFVYFPPFEKDSTSKIALDSTGRVIYPALPAGKYKAYALTENHPVGFVEFEIVPGKPTQATIKLKKGARLILSLKGKNNIAKNDKVFCICKIQQAKNGVPIMEDTNGGFRRHVFTLNSHSEDTMYIPLHEGQYTVDVQNRLAKDKYYINSLISQQTRLLKVEAGKDIIWDVNLNNLKN